MRSPQHHHVASVSPRARWLNQTAADDGGGESTRSSISSTLGSLRNADAVPLRARFIAGAPARVTANRTVGTDDGDSAPRSWPTELVALRRGCTARGFARRHALRRARISGGARSPTTPATRPCQPACAAPSIRVARKAAMGAQSAVRIVRGVFALAVDGRVRRRHAAFARRVDHHHRGAVWLAQATCTGQPTTADTQRWARARTQSSSGATRNRRRRVDEHGMDAARRGDRAATEQER